MYNRDVVILFRLSSKSDIIIESNFILPRVSLFSRFVIFLSLLISLEFFNLLISSLRFCFLSRYFVISSICFVSLVGSES